MSTLALSKRRVAKNAVSQVFAFGVSGATKAFAAILVARSLGPHGFGTFTFVWTVASMISFFAPLGLDYRLIRELNRGAKREEIEMSLSLALISSLVLSAAVALGPMVVGAGHEITASLFAAAGFIVLSAPVLVFRGAFHARERMELETFGLVTEGVVSLVAVTLLLAAGGGVAAAMVGLVVGRAANLLTSVFFYRRLYGSIRMRLGLSESKRMLAVSIPMGFSYMFHTMMLRFDVVMLAMMRSPEEVGIYSAATVIVMTIPMIATAFNSSLYPVLSRSQGSDDPELRKVFSTTWRTLMVCGLASAAGLTVLATPIVELFYGDGFSSTAWVIACLAWILPLRFVNNLSGVILNATDKQSGRTLVVGIAAGFNLLANFALIPLWGYQGAVVSTLVTEVVLTFAVRRVLGPLSQSFWGPVLAGALVAGIVGGTVSFTPGHVFVRAAIGATLFALVVSLGWWGRRLIRAGVLTAKEAGA